MKQIILIVIILTISSCAKNNMVYVCPPCAYGCDNVSYTKKGIRPTCKMTLIEKPSSKRVTKALAFLKELQGLKQ
jgi:hypothetical protein